jgi:hypothetical protein
MSLFKKIIELCKIHKIKVEIVNIEKLVTQLEKPVINIE